MKEKNDSKVFLKEEELTALKNIQKQSTALRDAFAQLKIDQLALEDREKELENYHRQLQKASSDLGKQFDSNYGKGSINLDTGEFTPSE